MNVSISAGTASYFWDTTTTDANADLASANIDNGFDILYATTFFLSQGGVNTDLINATTTSTGDTGNATFSGINGVLDISIDLLISEINSITGLNYTPTITNTSGTQQTGSLLFYFDFDIGFFFNNSGYLSGDTITSNGPIAPAGAQVSVQGINNDGYEIDEFSDLIIGLENDTITSLANTGYPFSSADFTAAFQWDFSLNPGDSVTIQIISNYIPEPKTTTFLIIFSIIFALKRKRSKISK